MKWINDMIKLVVSDFDGTLRTKGNTEPTPSVLAKIKSIIDNGIFFAVSSGRLLCDLDLHFPEIASNLYFISSDGALITKNNKIIFTSPFTHNAVSFFFNSFKGQGSVRFFSKDKTFVLGEKIAESDIPVVYPHQINESIYKIICYNMIASGFEAFSRIHYSNSELVEFAPLLANKGVALGALQRHLGVSLYDTLAMGDRDNDIPMMKNAKYKVSVGNRCERIYKATDIHVSDPDEILQKVWLKSDF